VQLPGGHWAIRSNANGLFVSAELGYSGNDAGLLRARTPFTSLGPWEVFDIITNSDGTHTLQSTPLGNQEYVSIELGYSGPHYGELRARAPQISLWEEFDNSTAAPGNENLGAPDFNGYCLANGHGNVQLVQNNAYGWVCSGQNNVGLDAQAVCSWTFSSPNIANRIENFNDPNSWQCWRSMHGELGSLDWNAYCQDLGHPGALDEGLNNAYTWTCQNGGNMGLDSQTACATLYPADIPPISRFQSFYDKNSWQCWG